VSEAWQVLSKPESRAEYDALRAITLPDMQKVYKADTVNADGFKIQRDNFVHVQKAASSNWRDLGGKYQSEKWQKIPLADKKVSLTLSHILIELNSQ
jgi:curved DNA-binding protein CbpA